MFYSVHGYVNYDYLTEQANATGKIDFHVNSYAGKSDFDKLRFLSYVGRLGIGAELNIDTYDLNINGVKNIPIYEQLNKHENDSLVADSYLNNIDTNVFVYEAHL